MARLLPILLLLGLMQEAKVDWKFEKGKKADYLLKMTDHPLATDCGSQFEWEFSLVAKEVDTKGIATLEMSFDGMRIGYVTIAGLHEWDSADGKPAGEAFQMRGALLWGRKLGLKVDRTGKIREVTGVKKAVDAAVKNMPADRAKYFRMACSDEKVRDMLQLVFVRKPGTYEESLCLDSELTFSFKGGRFPGKIRYGKDLKFTGAFAEERDKKQVIRYDLEGSAAWGKTLPASVAVKIRYDKHVILEYTLQER